MKHLYPILMLLLGMTAYNNAGAQQYIYTMGATSVANAFPFGDATNNTRQNLYFTTSFTPTAPAGTITKVYFQPSGSGTYVFTNLSIKIGYTSLSSFTSGPWVTGLTTVFTGSGSFPTNSGGWIEVTLQTPFSYNASSSFIVEASQGGFSPGFSAVCDNTTAATDRSLYGNSGSTTATVQARVLKLGFDLTIGSPCNAPTGLAASAITNNSATLSWNAVSSSQGYEYILDQSAANPSGSGIATSATSYPATGLNPSTTYYMHVRNKCGTTSFSSWVTVSFTTLTAPITCPPPTTVIMSGLTSSMANFSWNTVSAATSYEYKVDQVATGPTSGWSTTFSNNATVNGLTENTGYYFHVRNVCIAPDKSSWLNYAFTTLICSKPTNVLVSNVGDTSADLMWSQMPSAASYDYAVDFSNQNPTTGIKNTTGITTHLSSLIPNSKYYIHVRSRCFTVDSSGWRLDSFITKMNCYAPAVQVNYLGTNNPYAYWQPVPTAVAYEYALNNSSNPPAFGATIYITNISTLNLPEDGKDYYLHVRTKCNSQFTFSPWATVALRTDATGVPQVQHNGISLYPNPAKNTLYVKGANGGNYTINDITGREVINGPANQGFAKINIAELAPGTYMLKLQGNLQIFRFVKE